MAAGIPTTAEAVAASVACARLLGLPTEDPEVVAEGYSVRVRLRPAPIVTRVVTLGRSLRGDPWPWLRREVAVARHLEAAGVPVVGCWDDPGPHAAGGLEVSLWHWTDHRSDVVDPLELAASLATLHDALATYDADLPLLVGPLTDIDTALRASDDDVLHRAADELLPLAHTWPRRPLHGDVHTGNVLTTDHGPRWTDFEDVCCGPVEWDLGSVTLTEETVAAYPGPVDRERLEDCRDLRRLQVLASMVVGDFRDDALRDRLVGGLSRRGRG